MWLLNVTLARGKGNQQKGIHISLLQDDVTALMIAVYHGHSHIVEVLTRFKPGVNFQTKVGVVTYCSICSACFSCAVTWYIAFSLVRGTSSYWDALRSGIQSPSTNERALYTMQIPCLDYGMIYVGQTGCTLQVHKLWWNDLGLSKTCYAHYARDNMGRCRDPSLHPSPTFSAVPLRPDTFSLNLHVFNHASQAMILKIKELGLFHSSI